MSYRIVSKQDMIGLHISVVQDHLPLTVKLHVIERHEDMPALGVGEIAAVVDENLKVIYATNAQPVKVSKPKSRFEAIRAFFNKPL